MRYCLLVMLLVLLNSTVNADPLSSLTLTTAEMQKLKQYFPVDEETHLVWKGEPITIALPLNKEKRLIFPYQVSVDVKSALTTDQLRLLNNDKSIYLTALKPFATTRIYVTLKDSSKVVLIDLLTDQNANNATQQIDVKKITDDNRKETDLTEAHTVGIEVATETENTEASFPSLVRFAWQQTYSPERLLHQHSLHLARAPMHTEKFVSGLIYGDKIIAFPESSWVSGDHYVTVVFIRNKYSLPTHIDIRKELCGDWLAASIYPSSYLRPYGNKQNDTATLFLVSGRPFGESMGACHVHA